MFTFKNLTLLYIEGEIQAREKYALLMRNNGLRVFTADNIAGAYDLYQTHKIDLIIIDFPPYDEGSLNFIRHLRQTGNDIPIIITTACVDKELLVSAINLDISRYLIQPFEGGQILNAVVAAAKNLSYLYEVTIVNLHHGFSYDLINKSVECPDGAVVHLSKKEYRFLELLLENKGKIIPYETIESIIWQNSSMSIDALRTLVRAIRKKTYKNIIVNHSAIGYNIDL